MFDTLKRALMIGLVALALAGAPAGWAGGPETMVVARDFTLSDVTGRTWTLAEQKGKVVVLSFWATWCGPCRLELPRLHDVYKRHKREPVEMFAISVDNAATVALVPAFAEQMRLSFPVLLDTDNKVVMHYDPQGIIPFTVVIDQQGRVRHVHPGYNPGDEARVEQEVVELLREAANAARKVSAKSGQSPKRAIDKQENEP